MGGFDDIIDQAKDDVKKDDQKQRTPSRSGTGTTRPRSPSSSGSTGGSATTSSKTAQYIKAYKRVYMILGIRANAKLMAKYAAQELSPSEFRLMIRRYDRRYVNSNEYKNRASEYLKAYRTYFPGTKADAKDMLRFVRGEYGTARLDQYIRGTKRFKKLYPYIRKDMTAPDYRTYVSELASAMKDYYGERATPEMLKDYTKTMFHSGVTSQAFGQYLTDIKQNIGLVQAAQESANWAGQAFDMKRAILGGQKSEVERQKLYQAMQTQAGFNKSELAPFQLANENDIMKQKGL